MTIEEFIEEYGEELEKDFPEWEIEELYDSYLVFLEDCKDGGNES